MMSDDERDIESDADKRAHHNALERKRRDHIKDSFSSLRDSIPSLHGEKASRAQILKKAAEYIQTMRKKNTSHQQDIDDLRKQNKVLEEQIRALEKAKSGGFSASIIEKNKSSESISSLEGMSDSEDGVDATSDGDNTLNAADLLTVEYSTESQDNFDQPASKRIKVEGKHGGRV